MSNKNNKKIIVLLVFIIAVLSLTSFITISRFAFNKELSGTINPEIIKINFTPNGDNEYKISQSTVVNVTHKASTNFRTLKYEFTNTQVDASVGTSFTNGDTITKTNVEGVYYLCVYAEDVNGLHNNACSEGFYVDNKAPRMIFTTEETATTTFIVVEVQDVSGVKSLVSNDNLTLDHVDGNKYYYVATNASTYSFTATDNLDNAETKSYILCNKVIGTLTNFDYTGNAQEFIATCPGQYKVEAWGAQGGGNTDNIQGGKGGYTAGVLTLEQPRSLFVYVGGAGNQNVTNEASVSQGGYNGGGNGMSDSGLYRIYGSGGGATDIRLTNGEWYNFDSLKSRLMVAAGGGGAYAQENTEWFNNGGYAGGLTGGNGSQVSHWGQTYCYGQGGIQNSGVSSTSDCSTTYASEPVSSGFGFGGSNKTGTPATGGGAGYYGGSRSGHVASAGGGSSFISGYAGCNAITEGSTENSITHTGQPNHYSGYVFTNPVMIDGAGCNWATGTAANCFVQPQPNGGRSDGHAGNGYARIIYLGDNEDHIITLNSDNFTNHGTTGVVGKYYNNLPSITVPTTTDYIFTGYYDNQNAFDLTYSLPTAASTNYRINFVDEKNGWSMTNADAGTHINAKITLNTLEIPQVEFNDRVIIPYKTEITSNQIILYLDFDITSEMVTNTQWNYETQFRFIDLFFTNSIAPNSITVDHVTKNGTKYYNAAGQSVFPYNKDVRTLYAHREHSSKKLYDVLRYEYLEGGSARKYTSAHQDSMNASLSTQDIYYWFASSSAVGTEILKKNNVIFAGQCWQIIRTTDTGGVRLLYNGEAENNQCLNTRGTHVGYSGRSYQTLNSSYYYGTSYTYDSSAKTFKLSGTISQATWSESTGPGLVGKYTCKQTSSTATCSTLYYIESYYSATNGYALALTGNSSYSQFGTLPFNSNSYSIADVGYMYNTRYTSTSKSMTSTNTLLNSYTLNTSYYYADSAGMGSAARYWKLLSPYQVSSVSDNNNLVDKYTFFSTSSTYENSRVCRIKGVSGTTAYYISLSRSSSGTYSTDNFYRYRYGTSYSLNSNNKYEISGGANFDTTTYFQTKGNLSSGKYICRISGANDTVCQNNPTVITGVYNYGYGYLQNVTVGNSVSYGTSYSLSGTTYSLIDFRTSDSKSKIANAHYAQITGSSSSTAYIISQSGNYLYYVTLTGGKNIGTAITEMLTASNVNVNDSVIKKGLEAWYEKYIYPYDSYVDDTIYCNYRTIKNLYVFNPNGGAISSSGPDFYNYNSSYTAIECPNTTDKFSYSNSSAKLKYKVSLIPASELFLLNYPSARNTGSTYWTLSPSYYGSNGIAYNKCMGNDGSSSSCQVSSSYGVRPSITLKAGTEFISGDGSMSRPYIIN